MKVLEMFIIISGINLPDYQNKKMLYVILVS